MGESPRLATNYYQMFFGWSFASLLMSYIQILISFLPGAHNDIWAPILTQYSSHLSALVLAQTSVNYDIVNLYGIHFFVATWFHCFLTSHPIFVNVASALFWHMSGLNTCFTPSSFLLLITFYLPFANLL